MKELDWEDIFYHTLAGLVIGLMAGLLVHMEIKEWSLGWSIIWANTIGWFIREYLQKPNKERLWTHLQVIIEYAAPALAGWPTFFAGKTIVERFLL